MIKAEIVKRVADHLKMRDKEALVVIDSIIDSMKKVVAEQGRLEIRDFGVLQTKTRKERVGRNPKDKKEYPIPSRRVVTFKMGRELKHNGETNPELKKGA
jgi:nucleoid DNA-binding protein